MLHGTFILQRLTSLATEYSSTSRDCPVRFAWTSGADYYNYN